MTTILGGLVILVYVTVTDIRRELSALELLRDILRETGRNARAASFKAMESFRSLPGASPRATPKHSDVARADAAATQI